MNENARKPVERMHRDALERHQEQQDKGRELVKAMFRKALGRDGEKTEQDQALVEQLQPPAVEPSRCQPLPPYDRPTIHYTELPPAQSDSQLCQEWNFYRREVGRLLAEGQEGRFVQIKREDIIGIWDTQEEAQVVALTKYLMQPCLIHQVRSREPLLRGPTRLWRCNG